MTPTIEPYPCTQIHRLDTLEKREDTIIKSLEIMENRFDAKLDLILSQINKIAVLEVNHQNASSAINRAFVKLEEVERTTRELSTFRDHTEGMAKMAWLLWGIMGTGLGFLILKAIF